MTNRWVSVAGVLGALGVILGAFGAHGLKDRLSADLLTVFEVGVRYHMYHALAMLAAGLALRQLDNRWLDRACWAWVAGIAVFSGSLYALALTNVRWLGAVTPFGGVAFIVGWGCIALAGWRGSRSNAS